MHLSGRQTSVLGDVMATLAEPRGEAEIRARVGALMLDLLGAQHCASYVWDPDRRCFVKGAFGAAYDLTRRCKPARGKTPSRR